MHIQIENLQEQLRDKEKQMSSLKERVKSLQADTTNTDTALTTLEEALAEKVSDWSILLIDIFLLFLINLILFLVMRLGYRRQKNPFWPKGKRAPCAVADTYNIKKIYLIIIPNLSICC